MSAFLLVVFGFGAVLLLYSIVRYLRRTQERVLTARERCEKAWSDIEVLIERRHSELEDLIDVTNEHVSHERELLNDVLDSRTEAIEAGNPDQAANILLSLRQATDEVFSLAKDHPELESNKRFDELAESIRELEQRLENRREVYNAAVSSYNALLDAYPESYFADRQGLEPREPFEASAAAKEGFEVRERLEVGGRQD